MSSKSLSRSVILEILGKNKDAKDKIDEISKAADDLGKKKATATIGADTKDAKKNIDDVSVDVDKFGKKNVSATAGVSTKDGKADLGDLAGVLTGFGKRDVSATAGVNTKDGKADLDDISTDVDKFGKKNESATAGVDTTKGKTILGQLSDALSVFGKRNDSATAGVNTKEGKADLDDLGVELDKFSHSISTGTAKLDDDDAKEKIIDLNTRLKKFADETYTADVDANDDKAKAKLINIQLELDKIGRAVATPDVDDRGMLKASLEMDRLKIKMDALSHDTVDIKVKESGGRSGILEIFGGLLGGGAGGGGRQFMNQLSYAGSEDGDGFIHSFIKASAFGMKGGIITLGGMLLGALPAIGAITGGLIGVALIGGLAAVLLAKDAKVKSAFSKMGTQVMSTLEKTIQPLVPYVLKIVNEIVPLIKQIAPILTGIFREIGPQLQGIFNNVKTVVEGLVQVMRAAAPAFGPMINALLDLVKAILPPMAASIRALIPSLKLFGGMMSSIGHDLASLFQDAAPVIKASMLVLSALMRIIGSLIPIIMKLGDIFAQALGPILQTITGIFVKLTPTIVAFGKILGGLAAAVLGSFIGIITALAHLLVAIEPSIKILINTFGQLFKTLENTGAMFVLEDAVEGLVKPFAALINALVKGLAPVLPVVIRLFGDLLGILSKGAGAVLGALATAFAAIINAIPPSMLHAIAYGIIAIVAATKLWALANSGLLFAMKLIGVATAANAEEMEGLTLVEKAQALWIGVCNIASKAYALTTGLLNIAINGSVVAMGAMGLVSEETIEKIGAMTLAQKLNALWTTVCAAATKVWSGVMIVFNAIMDADPIVLITLAIIALIAVVVEAALHFKTWGKWVLLGVALALGPIGLLAIAAYEVIKHWKVLEDFFKELWKDMKQWAVDAWNGIKSISASAWNELKTIITEMPRFFEQAWNVIRNAAVTTWHAIENVAVQSWHGIEAGWSWLGNVLKSGVQTIERFYIAAWDLIKTTAVAVWHAIEASWSWLAAILKSGFNTQRELWNTVWNGMKTLAVAVWHAVGSAWTWLYDLMKSGITETKNIFTTAWDDIKNLAVAVWHAIASAWDWLYNILKSGVTSTKNFFVTAWTDIKNFVVSIWHDIYALWNTAVGIIKDGITNLKNFFTSVWTDIKNFVVSVWHDIYASWNTAVGIVKDGITNLKNFFTSVWTDIKNFVVNIWHDLYASWNACVGIIKDGITNAKNFFFSTWTNIKNFFGTIVGSIRNTWNDMIGYIKNGMSNALNWIENILGKIKNAFRTAIDFVENDVLKPLFDVWNKIAAAVGLKSLEIHIGSGAADGGMVPGRYADGGPARMAGGGNVGGNGITDCVPAVLKPGEYVMNRRQVSNAGGAPNIEKNYGYSSSFDGRHFADGGGPSLTNSSPTAPLSGSPSKGSPLGSNASPSGQIADPLTGGTYQVGGNGSSIFSDIWGGIKDIGKWGASLITKYALDPAISHILGPILNAMGSGLAGFGDLGTMLRQFVNTIVVNLMAKAENTGGGGGSGADIVAFAKTFIGKVPYHEGGGADYAPYGEIKTPADAVRLGGWDCVVGSTRVMTTEGPKVIRDVQPGDVVLSWHDGKMVEEPVTWKSEPSMKRVYHLRTNRRELTASGDHKMMVVGPEDTVTGRAQDYAVGYMPLRDIVPSDVVVTMASTPDSHEDADTDFAFLLGVAIGDGTRIAPGSNQVQICVYDVLRERVADIIEKLTGKRGHFDDKHGIHLSDAGLAEALRQNGLSVKSSERRVPSGIWRLSHAVLQAFTDGYTAADGSRSGRDQAICYATASRQLAEDVRLLHIMLGHNVTVVREMKRRHPVRIKGVRVTDARSLWRFQAYDHAGRKSNARLLSYPGVRALFPEDSHFTPERVISVEPAGEAECYDITVQGVHNFIANEIVTHNCAGFVGQMYGHFGIGPGTAGINVTKLEGWGKKTKTAVVGGFATEAGIGTVQAPGHVVLIANPTTSIQSAHTGTDTIMLHDSSAWVQTYVPPKGFGAAAADEKAGSSIANGKAIYSYLGANLFGGSKIGAAGAIASIWGESGWNPESAGTGGRGLIGWTPPSKLPNSAFTGNATHDLDAQLPLIINFVTSNGDMGTIDEMKKASSVSDAAQLWCHGVERAGIDDVHGEGITLATQIMSGTAIGGSAGAGRSYSNAQIAAEVKKLGGENLFNGGIITEPILGQGLYSGRPYSLGEFGNEAVIPLSGSTSRGIGGDVYNIYPPESATNPDMYAQTLIQAIRRYKLHHGNQSTGIG